MVRLVPSAGGVFSALKNHAPKIVVGAIVLVLGVMILGDFLGGLVAGAVLFALGDSASGSVIMLSSILPAVSGFLGGS